MVRIDDLNNFKEAYHLAKKAPDPRTKHSFYRCLKTMNRLKRNYKGELHVCKDHVPYSFVWGIAREGRIIFNGGMECHGGNWTNFSVTLTPTTYLEWRIHT